MKRLFSFFLFTLLPLMAMSQDPITRPSKKPAKTNTTQKPPAKKPSKPQASQSQKPPRQTSQPTTGTINGHVWVDLGLSVKWATCNVGASSPSDYGDYFAWGETSPKSEYTTANSKTYEKSMGDIAGNSQYDAARANWGSTWRLPTKGECQELVDKCTWTWTSKGGHNGYLVTSKTNSNSIFLPAAGGFSGTAPNFGIENGHFWSSTPSFDVESAYYIDFTSSILSVEDYSRRINGYAVRPVSN